MGEVLLASFFVPVFALVTPLVFQVVIDKVLTHRSLTTLDVLAVALIGITLFEVILAGIRHYDRRTGCRVLRSECAQRIVAPDAAAVSV